VSRKEEEEEEEEVEEEEEGSGGAEGISQQPFLVKTYHGDDVGEGGGGVRERWGALACQG